MTTTNPNDETERRTDRTAAESSTPTPRRGPGPARPAEEYDGAESEAAVERGLDLDRREYLKALGAAGAAASLAGASTSSAVAQSGDWEADAEDRIEEHRKSDLEVVVQDESGNPVSDAAVDVEMQGHDYNFGTAVHAEFLRRGTEWDDPVEGTDEEDIERYRETIEENFNTIVLENHHKWLIWAEDQENYEDEDELPIADYAVDWALERDMDVRGHVCLWGNVDAWAVPPDVAGAMGVGFQAHDDWEGIDEDPEYVRERSMEHIERIIEHYGDDITEWEVVNEVINEPDMIYGVDGQGVEAHTAPILGDWYEHAEEIAEEHDVTIAINDFNTMASGEIADEFEEQTEYLVEERGIDLDGVGFQCHFGWYGPSSSQTRDPEGILEFCDRFAQYGVGLRTTEFDMFEGDGWTRENQAEYLHDYLKTWFSHEATEQFLMWGHWDPLHWGDELGHDQDAPLFEADWTPKPAYDVWRDLVFDEWWTEESGTTGSDGTFSTSAFLGEYEITATIGGEDVTETVSITDADGTTEVTVTTGEGGTGGDDECPVGEGETLSNGNTVCDIDGDGKYRDLTASGDTTTQDLQYFFENQHREPYDSRTDLFDFTDNGDVGQPDVVDLFHAI